MYGVGIVVWFMLFDLYGWVIVMVIGVVIGLGVFVVGCYGCLLCVIGIGVLVFVLGLGLIWVCVVMVVSLV